MYLRDRTRRLIGAEGFAAALRRALGDDDDDDTWAVSVIRHTDKDEGVDGSSPCALSRCLAAADVLITVHGFQSILGRIESRLFTPQLKAPKLD